MSLNIPDVVVAYFAASSDLIEANILTCLTLEPLYFYNLVINHAFSSIYSNSDASQWSGNDTLQMKIGTKAVTLNKLVNSLFQM